MLMILICRCLKCRKREEFKSNRENPRYEAQKKGWRIRGRRYICSECRAMELGEEYDVETF